MKRWVRKAVIGASIVSALGLASIGASKIIATQAEINAGFKQASSLMGAKTPEQKKFLKPYFLRARKLRLESKRKYLSEEVDRMLCDYIFKYGREGIDSKALERFDRIVKRNLLRHYNCLAAQQNPSVQDKQAMENIRVLYPKETWAKQ
jgi:hypothetical protein